MAGLNIAASRLSRNDISCLAKILETSFQYFCDHSSPFAEDYLKDISTIVGLGFTAVLVDRTFISIYQRYMHTFIQHSDFRKPEASLPQLSSSIAEMVDMACHLSGQINNSAYGEAFCASLKKVLFHMSVRLMENREEVDQLVEKILGIRSYL